MPGSTDRFYVHCYTKRMFLFMQQGIPRNFLLHKNSGRFYSCRRFHHILHMCAVFTAASFLSFAVSAIIHRVLRTVPCAVLAVSALVLCLIVGLGLAALHVVVHIIAVSCHFSYLLEWFSRRGHFPPLHPLVWSVPERLCSFPEKNF